MKKNTKDEIHFYFVCACILIFVFLILVGIWGEITSDSSPATTPYEDYESGLDNYRQHKIEQKYSR